MTNSAHGIARLIKATGYSIAGLRAAWQNEEAFRQETVLAVFLFPLSFWLGRDAVESALLLSTIVLVLISELFNSAIEALTDRVGTQHHELSGRAKDLASASVLIAVILLVVVWGLIAWERFA